VQRRTGIKNRPGQFPDDLPPYRPSWGKIVKSSEITFFPRNIDRFLLRPTPYRPTWHCPNASMASPPLRRPIRGRPTLHPKIRPRRRPTRRLSNTLLWWTLRNNINSI